MKALARLLRRHQIEAADCCLFQGPAPPVLRIPSAGPLPLVVAFYAPRHPERLAAAFLIASRAAADRCADDPAVMLLPAGEARSLLRPAVDRAPDADTGQAAEWMFSPPSAAAAAAAAAAAPVERWALEEAAGDYVQLLADLSALTATHAARRPRARGLVRARWQAKMARALGPVRQTLLASLLVVAHDWWPAMRARWLQLEHLLMAVMASDGDGEPVACTAIEWARCLVDARFVELDAEAARWYQRGRPGDVERIDAERVRLSPYLAALYWRPFVHVRALEAGLRKCATGAASVLSEMRAQTRTWLPTELSVLLRDGTRHSIVARALAWSRLSGGPYADHWRAYLHERHANAPGAYNPLPTGQVRDELQDLESLLDDLPPCMAKVVAAGRGGERHLKHMDRFHMAKWLVALGVRDVPEVIWFLERRQADERGTTELAHALRTAAREVDRAERPAQTPGCRGVRQRQAQFGKDNALRCPYDSNGACARANELGAASFRSPAEFVVLHRRARLAAAAAGTAAIL
jgi:hypothetical protein